MHPCRMILGMIKPKHVQIRLDEDTHRAWRVAAAERGTNVQALIVKAMARELSIPAPAKATSE